MIPFRPRGRPRTQLFRRVAIGLPLALVALLSTAASADEPGLNSPKDSDPFFRNPASQGVKSPDYVIHGMAYDDQLILPFPLLSRYNLFHKVYGDWKCYGPCAWSPSTYVMAKYDATNIFIDDTWWLGEKIQYTVGVEVTWRDNPEKATNAFHGPVPGARAYQQGTPDTHPLSDDGSCEPFYYSPHVTMYCANGGGLGPTYYHAPLFRNESSVVASDETGYFATGWGSQNWGWDGIA